MMRIVLPAETCRLLIVVLGVIAGLVIIGDYALAAFGRQTPAGVSGLAHVAVGGLIGLLVEPGEKSPPAPPLPSAQGEQA